MNKKEFQWNPRAIEGNAHETTNCRINCSIIIVLSSTKKQLQVSRRTYGLGSDGMERSGRLGEASGEINEALNVKPKKQFLGREEKSS